MLDIKRKLEELITIYALEEELRDIYVEGPTDKFLIENYCEYKNLEKTIIEIDTIDLFVTSKLFPDLNLKSNKDKLIALSRILQNNEIKSDVKCIIDRDFDGILCPLEANDYLRYTDYSCIESYFLCHKYIEKITKIGIRNFPYKSELVINEISKVLHGLFMIRMINKHFNFDCKFPKLENNMAIDKKTGVCGFNFDSYLELYINLNKLKGSEQKIKKFVSQISPKMDKDSRFNMNGHDFIEVLFNYINKIKNTPNFKLENFEKALFLSIQPNYHDEYELFKALCN